MDYLEPIDDRMSAEQENEHLKHVAEALIFAADEPVPASRIAAVYADVTGEDPPSEEAVRQAIDGLNRAYEEGGRTFRAHTWAGAYRMATIPEVSAYLKAFYDQRRQTRLSRSLLETLAILAYRQPATKPEVDFVRGVDCDYALRKLLELGLIEVGGRSDSLGRPLLYRTTDGFLEQFGLSGLDDLPSLREIEELLEDPAFNRERAKLLALEGTAPLPAPGEAEPTGDSDVET